MTDEKPNPLTLIKSTPNPPQELLADFMGDIWESDNFQEFIDGRKSYGDKWCHNWPKTVTCENCQKQFELYPKDLNGSYFSGLPFVSKREFPWLATYLKAIIECPNCEIYFIYITKD